ncbi:DUF397 domain-containing protein [Streptomyces xanthophaeus]|uniref:DUF397 domain-containing protein n=1 Tax=Streptomyces xanthophaeus TaxID=67385 RepID=UPI00399015E2
MSIKPSIEGVSALTWAKTRYSASDSNECVEVARTPGTVLVRDSKRPEDARLAVTPAAWTGFVVHAATP